MDYTPKNNVEKVALTRRELIHALAYVWHAVEEKDFERIRLAGLDIDRITSDAKKYCRDPYDLPIDVEVFADGLKASVKDKDKERALKAVTGLIIACALS